MSVSNAVIRACLLYEFKLGTKGAEAARKICAAFGEGTISERTAQKWFHTFSTGDETLEDKPRSGRPKSLDLDQLKAAIEEDSSQTCQELAQRFGVSDETIRVHLHELGKSWKLSKWVPHELTAANRLQRLNICSSLLTRNNNCPILDRILTCDEKWVMYDNKKRSYHWLSSNDSMPLSAKPALHQRKVMLCVWWTTAGIVHYEFLESGKTITKEVYSAQLQRVAEQLTKKQPALVNRKGVLFHQDNARPHTAKMTLEVISALGWELLPHPPYSPDVAPSDYHLFLSMDNYMRNRQFKTREEVTNAVAQFFESQEKDFFKNGIYRLVKRWEKVVEADGGYFAE